MISFLQSIHFRNAILFERFQAGLIVLTKKYVFYIEDNEEKWRLSHNLFNKINTNLHDIQLLANAEQNKFLIIYNNFEKGLLYDKDRFISINIKIPFSELYDLRYLWYDELFLFNTSSPCAVLEDGQIKPTNYLPLLKKHPEYKEFRRNKELHHYNANFIRTYLKDQIALYHDFTGEVSDTHLGIFSLKNCSTEKFPIPGKIPLQPIRSPLNEDMLLEYKGILTRSGVRMAYYNGLLAVIYPNSVYLFSDKKEIINKSESENGFHFIDGEFSCLKDSSNFTFHLILRNNADLSDTRINTFEVNYN